MINIFSIMGLIIAVLGLILFFIVKYLPMNPFLGLRIGYVYVSRRIWVKYNRLAGISLFIIGLVIIFLSTIIQTVSLLVAITLILVLSDIVLLSFLAAREAERELGKEAFKKERVSEYMGGKIIRIEPVKPSLPRFILMILPAILSVLLAVYYIPLLPDKIPVHFNIEGQPDRWEPFPVFVSTTLPLLVGFQLLPVIFLLVELKAPLVFYKPGLPKREVVLMLYDIGIIIAWIMFSALADTLYYAVGNFHLIPGELFMVIVLGSLSFIFIRIIAIWRKWRKELSKLYLTKE